jgi:hypothetical protein
MSDRKVFYLRSPEIIANAIAAVRAAGFNWRVTISLPKRTDEQNDKMWAMLGDVARAKPEGRNWTPETWKCAFMHYLGHQVMFAEGLDGAGPFPIGFRSSKLSVGQMSDLITCIYKYGDEHTVEWRETKHSGFDVEELRQRQAA